jgi:hypothetical protein
MASAARNGIAVDHAHSDLSAISSSEAAQKFVEMFGGKNSHVQVVPLHQQLAGNTRPALRMLLGQWDCSS